MRKKLNKKGAFNVINAGMIGFLVFVLIVILLILLISVTKSTTMVCPSDQTYDDGVCLACPTANFTDGGNWTYNSSSNLCCNQSNKSANSVVDVYCNETIAYDEYTGSAYNGTKEMQLAANLPPQFAQVIVITLVVVGIIGMLSMIGYGVYKKMNR